MPLAGLLLVTPARAQDEDDDEDEGPTLIREHGTPGASMKPGGAASDAKPTAKPTDSKPTAKPTGGKPAAAPAPTLEVKVREDDGPSPEEEPDDGPSASPRDEEPTPSSLPLDGPTIDDNDPALRSARQPLPEVELEGSLPWQRHGDVGVELAWLSRPFSNGLGASRTSYRPTVGVGVHMQWDVRRWLHVRPYFLWGSHSVDVAHGALSTSSPSSIRPDTVVDAIQAATFSFGVKIAPTWNLTPRTRVWFVAGVGYGRSSFRNVALTEPGGKPFTVPDRDGVFVDFPLGLGGAYEILPGRAAFTFEVTGAPAVGQTGTAYEPFQVVDPDGRLREVGAFGAIQATFAQTLGLAVYL